ncbi:transmembrane protein, putative [Medicago truncatula]|uniref:Transmembrane protein, putative n=1 Tax=Medicago truncatula TaxID=3880 RepID=G7KKW4_MEDTR|nr:transmembrane protein, putative [Medicago truncatula]
MRLFGTWDILAVTWHLAVTLTKWIIMLRRQLCAINELLNWYSFSTNESIIEVWQDSLNVIYRRSFELYCKDLQDFAPDQQSTRITESSPSSVTKTQKEKDILKYDMLNGKITKPKKSKASLSENQELLDELKKMRENQEKTNLIMENMMSFIQNRFSGEDVNAIIQASRQLSYIILLVVFIFTLLVITLMVSCLFTSILPTTNYRNFENR